VGSSSCLLESLARSRCRNVQNLTVLNLCNSYSRIRIDGDAAFKIQPCTQGRTAGACRKKPLGPFSLCALLRNTARAKLALRPENPLLAPPASARD